MTQGLQLSPGQLGGIKVTALAWATSRQLRGAAGQARKLPNFRCERGHENKVL